jgi:hypothetical protein
VVVRLSTAEKKPPKGGFFSRPAGLESFTAWEQVQRQQQVLRLRQQLGLQQVLRLRQQLGLQRVLRVQQRVLRQERQQVPLLFCRKRTEQRRPAGW